MSLTFQPTCSFYTKLNNLEHHYFQEETDKEELMQLIHKIAELVQFFDLRKDPIKEYFLEKMQYILSRPFTLLTLRDQITKTEIKKRFNCSHFSQTVQKLEKQSLIECNQQENQDTILSLQQVLIYHILQDYEKQQFDQQQLINNDYNQQISVFKNKLLHRKNKSLFSPTNNQKDEKYRLLRQSTYYSATSQYSDSNGNLDDSDCTIQKQQ